MVVVPEVHGDERGVFVETYRREWFPRGREMIQGNRSNKQAGAVVGLHFHLHQADYWYVPQGRARVVLHDLRVGSPTERATLELEIGHHDHRGVWIPPGVAHGFCALEGPADVLYKCTAPYAPEHERTIAWNDPEVAIRWPIRDPRLSPRDAGAPRLRDAPVLPSY